MRTEIAELVRIAAQSVIREHEALRNVDPQRLQWAREVLAANPTNPTPKHEQPA